jgi:hypothetical protein
MEKIEGDRLRKSEQASRITFQLQKAAEKNVPAAGGKPFGGGLQTRWNKPAFTRAVRLSCKKKQVVETTRY